MTMDIGAVREALLVAAFGIAWLGAMFVMANPGRFSLGTHRSEAERAAEIGHDRRHHRRARRAIPAILAVATGVNAITMITGAPEDRAGGLVLAAISITSLTVFVLLIRRGRRGRRDR
ncbi:hypothetical protein [Micromonospora sp. NPDC049497]|uniref:hypothetical protein n=1 Tax=Micromonospora sp. NPDC049497 TaxID=3364273 RepID=UPI00378A933A